MTELKPGDRVHVEFDGTICRRTPMSDDDPRVLVMPDGSGFTWRAAAYPEHCTKIVLPVQVGDTVTAENIEQLGERSVIAADEGVAWTRDMGSWRAGVNTMTHRNVIQLGDLRVLRIGGAS